MDPTSGGAGSSDTNSGEGPSSATAPAVVYSYDLLSDVDIHKGHPPAEALSVVGGFSISPSGISRPVCRWAVAASCDLLSDVDIYKGHPSAEALSVVGGFSISPSVSPWAPPHRDELVKGHIIPQWAEGEWAGWAGGVIVSPWALPPRDELVKGLIVSPWAWAKCHTVSSWVPHSPLFATIVSNQGESSGGRAGEERNGGGGDGNQGIGGGVGGGGQREGIGNERRGSRGRSHGGGNGDDDDDDDDRGGQFGHILDGGRPRGPRPDRMPEMLLSLIVQVIAALESLDVTMLSARARILRVVSLGFNSGAFVCFSASIRQRGTNPRLASILSWIGSVATFLGFISMIAMALLASFIP